MHLLCACSVKSPEPARRPGGNFPPGLHGCEEQRCFAGREVFCKHSDLEVLLVVDLCLYLLLQIHRGALWESCTKSMSWLPVFPCLQYLKLRLTRAAVSRDQTTVLEDCWLLRVKDIFKSLSPHQAMTRPVFADGSQFICYN